MHTAHRTTQLDGISVFYREAGDLANPKLLLLAGFPASSHQFRRPIPALADRFQLLSNPQWQAFLRGARAADAHSLGRERLHMRARRRSSVSGRSPGCRAAHAGQRALRRRRARQCGCSGVTRCSPRRNNSSPAQQPPTASSRRSRPCCRRGRCSCGADPVTSRRASSPPTSEAMGSGCSTGSGSGAHR